MAAGEVDELFGSLDDGAAFEKHPLEPARNRSGSVVTGAQLARTAQRALGHLGFGLTTIGGDVHAVVDKVTINDREAAEKRLREQTVPRVSQLPGVVAGYWTRCDGSDGLSMVVFESEDAARAAADQVPQMVSESVTLESVEVREVVANV